MSSHNEAHDEHEERDLRTMQLREEELRARTTPVETGRVSLGTDVVTEQRSIDVPVTREEVIIERHAVDRQPSDTPIGNADETIEVPVYADQVTAEKRAVVYEEVGIDKHTVQETQRVAGTVRREEARIEADGDLQRDAS